ncbi:MAG TPA: CPBP family intramembrane glutamic endopeptidase [Polyangiales bacterium]|nr:CPBP family intramembrane glutamic endopeptidase [Polyangiales bacterium]
MQPSVREPTSGTPEAARPADEPAQRPWPRLAVLSSLILVWFVLIQRFGEGDVYAVVGPYGCAVCAVSIASDPRAIWSWLAPRARDIWIGLAVGILMTALTYPVFRLGVAIEPSLDAQVQGLYVGARSTTLPKALTWVVAIICAEELLFRGAFPATLQRWLPRRAAFSLSLIAYTLAQYGTGSWIVMAMAGVCGSIWTVQRLYTNSLLSPLISHLIWSPTVILLYPVT